MSHGRVDVRALALEEIIEDEGRRTRTRTRRGAAACSRMMPRLETAVNAIGRCTRLKQDCIQLVNHNVAADVSRLKLSNRAQLSECSAENNDPADIRTD